jgi:hypothetical protein
MPIIRNAIGSGMIAMMGVMGALGTAAFIVSSQMNQSEKSLKKDAGVESYKQLVELVRRNLYSGNNCTVALGKSPQKTEGTMITSAAMLPNSTTDNISLNMAFGNNSDGTKNSQTLASAWSSKTGVKIKDIKIRIDQIVRPTVRIMGDPSPKVAAMATLFLEPDNRGINIYKKRPNGTYIYENLFIKLFVYFESDSTNAWVHSCYDPNSDAAFCTSALHGAFDPGQTESAKRCQPDVQCFASKLGVIDESVPCEAGFSDVIVGSQEQPDGSILRKKICNWCNPDPAPVSSIASLSLQVGSLLDLDMSETETDGADCNSSGYGNLSETESFETMQEYGGLLPLLEPSQASPFAECFNYVPPEPPTNAAPETSEAMAFLVGILQEAAPTAIAVAANNGIKVASPDLKTYWVYSPTQVNAALSILGITPSDPSIAGTTSGSTDGTTSGSGDGGIGSDYDGSLNCFVAGTQVTLESGSTMAIEDVRIGDTVLTYDEKEKTLISRPVIKTFHHEAKKHVLYTFTFSDGTELTSNDVHRFYVMENKNYLQAQEIYSRWIFRQPVSLLTDNEEVVTITKLEISEAVVPLFNLHVAGRYDRRDRESSYNHNYFANGILSHNVKDDCNSNSNIALRDSGINVPCIDLR